MKKTILIGLFLATIAVFAQKRYAFDYTGVYKIIENGDSLPLAWAGGLNQPQFNSIDLNLDGVMDLVVFDKAGNRIVPFLHLTNGGQQFYRYAPQFVKNFPELEHWMLLRDYNCDGKMDIFCGVSNGIGVYTNTSDTALNFTWALATSYLPTNYGPTQTNLKVLTTDIPSIYDIDNDGDLDILTFPQGGLTGGSGIEFHENKTSCGLQFEINTYCWGRFLEGQLDNRITINGCSSSILKTNDNSEPANNLGIEPEKVMHAGSSTLLLDLNNDNLFDMLLGDVSFSNINACFNTGTADSAYVSAVDSTFPNYNTPADLFFPAMFYEDVDFDGVPDLLLSSNVDNYSKTFNCVWYYKNNGTVNNPNFSLQDTAFLQRQMVELGESSVPVLIDLNTDGLLDLVVSCLGDVQGSGTPRLFMNYYQNIGTATNPEFELITNNLGNVVNLGIGRALVSTFGDLDGDMDVDMIVGADNGKLYYFENNGSLFNPSFTLTQANYQNIDVGGHSAPQLFDIDDDGDLDLMIGNELGKIVFYENNGLTPPAFSLVSQNFGGVNVSSKDNSLGFSIPHFIRTNDTVALFVGSERLGIIQYDSVDFVLNQPAVLQGTIGSDTITSQNVNTTPFGASKRNGRNQLLYTANELKAAGFTIGKITSISFHVAGNSSTTILSQGFEVKMKNVVNPNLNNWDTGFTSVFNQLLPLSSGWNTIALLKPFVWDGTSDLLIEICFSKNFQSTDINVTCTDIGFGANAYGDVTNWNSVVNDGCAMPYLGVSTLRPNIQLTLVPTLAETETVLKDGHRNAIAIGDLNGDQYLDAILGNRAGGITFYKGTAWKPSTVGFIDYQLRNETLVVYPNPADESTLVELPTKLADKNVQIQILDVMGRLIFETESKKQEEVRIDVRALQNGLYLVIVRHLSEVYHARVAINH